DQARLRDAKIAAAVTARAIAVVAALAGVEHAVAAVRMLAVAAARVRQRVVVAGAVVALLLAIGRGDAVAADPPGLETAVGVAAVAAELVPVVALLVEIHHPVTARRECTRRPAGVGGGVAVAGTRVALLARRLDDAVAAPGVEGRHTE